MIVTSDILPALAAGLKTDFDAAYNDVSQNADWSKVASDMQTTLPTQNYGWLGHGALMEEVDGEPREQDATMKNYVISDKEFAARETVRRKAYEDDQFSLIAAQMRRLATEPNRHHNRLVFNTLIAGFNTPCYDGQYFFDGDHAEGDSGTQSNVTNADLSDGALEAAEAAMMAFVDDKGEPLEIMPNLLVVGPANARKAGDLLGSEVVVKQVGSGAAGAGATAYTPYDNYYKGRYGLIVSPYLRGAAAKFWMLLDTSKIVRPVVLQSRSDVPVEFRSNMTDENALMNGKFTCQARGRYNTGFGLWQTAYGSNCPAS